MSPNISSENSLRVIPSGIGPVVPVVDIADMIGYTADHLTKKIRENPDVFKERQVLTDLSTAGGTQKCTCLDRVGFDRLLLLLKPGKNRDVFERIEAFRLKAFGELSGNSRQLPAPAPEKFELDPVVADGLNEAREIAKLTGTDPKLMQAAFLRNNGYPELADVMVPPAPAYVHGETGWYNPSGLVELCNDPNLTPERLNRYLENYRENGEWRPFQYREGKLWRLTKRGMDHGREYQFNLGNGHSEPRIAWRESILYASGLKRPLASDQAALPARAEG